MSTVVSLLHNFYSLHPLPVPLPPPPFSFLLSLISSPPFFFLLLPLPSLFSSSSISLFLPTFLLPPTFSFLLFLLLHLPSFCIRTIGSGSLVDLTVLIDEKLSATAAHSIGERARWTIMDKLPQVRIYASG